MGALRFGSDRAVVGADGGRPTSRGLPPAKACVGRRCLAPVGQGALPVCAFDAVCPCGAKALQSGAPDHGASRKGAGFRNVSPLKGLSRRAGERGNGLPAGAGDTRRLVDGMRWGRRPDRSHRPLPAVPRAECAFPPGYPNYVIFLWRIRALQGALHCPRVSRRRHPARAPRLASRARKSQRPSRHRLISQTIPQGERRALPAPAQGSRPLRIPFWGTGSVSQNAAGGRPLLVGLPPSTPTTAPFGTKRSKSAPCSWGGLA